MRVLSEIFRKYPWRRIRWNIWNINAIPCPMALILDWRFMLVELCESIILCILCSSFVAVFFCLSSFSVSCAWGVFIVFLFVFCISVVVGFPCVTRRFGFLVCCFSRTVGFAWIDDIVSWRARPPPPFLLFFFLFFLHHVRRMLREATV